MASGHKLGANCRADPGSDPGLKAPLPVGADADLEPKFVCMGWELRNTFWEESTNICGQKN